MRFSSWRRPAQLTAVAVLCTACVLPAQTSTKSARSKTELATKPPHPKLTAQQKLGLRQLEIAQAEAAGSAPEMRAFVLWQASRGVAKIDPPRANALLKDALTATQYIESTEASLKDCGEPVFCGPGHWLREQILRDMIWRSKQFGRIEQLLANAEPEFRQMLSSALFERYIDEKNFDRARELLNQLAEDRADFPYWEATALIEALPAERAGDRVAIFSQALESFTQHRNELYPGFADPATMVLRFWQELPAPLVLEAIDQLLDRAKGAEQVQQNTSQQNTVHQNLRVGISTNKGDAYFASPYEFRLFQLMPVLEQLDQPRAESLRRESSDVQAALERYPHGLRSLGALSDGPGSPGIFSIGAFDNSGQNAAEQAGFDVARRQERVLSEAEKNPRQALSDALGLPLTDPQTPDYSPRVSTLQSVARIAITRNPAVARAALQEVRSLVDPMPARSQALMLENLPDLYLRLGDEANARKILDQLVAVAAKLYEKDSDLGDPNQVFKVWWPSANLWWQCIAFAAKLNPSPAEQIIEEIQDDEIKAFERIALADSLLGAPGARLSILERHTSGGSVFINR
jgi:tetratricopeptide (TPR) repeat protein